MEATAEQPHAGNYRPLRVWIPMVLVALMIVARYFMVWFPELPAVWMVGSFVPALLGLLILAWWVMLSRATWLERIVGALGIVVVLAGIGALLHSSMQGPPFIVLTLPLTMAGFAIASTAVSKRLSFSRTWAALAVSLLAGGFSLLLQNDGAKGDFSFGFDWRWNPSAEDKFLASRRIGAVATSAVDRPALDALSDPVWPGFRGPRRDGIYHGVAFSSDWNQRPPQEIWRIRVGPAWSSFAVAGNFLFTQEQRGDNEAVVCYQADSGREVWAQEIRSRFFEALGGLGPRGTPTLNDGHVYALGAEGWLMKLSGVDGELKWKVDLKELTKQPPPMWGYSGSPLVHEGLVIVHAAGSGDRGLVAFDTDTGEVRWSVPADKDSYSSPHLATYFGETFVSFLGNEGLSLFRPETGERALFHEAKTMGYRALQPAILPGEQVLFTSEYGGASLIQVSHEDKGLTSTELWNSRGLKPDFNDFVVHEGYAYGFDGAIFACLDLATGERRWKDGRYGKGQVLLLQDSALLLVVSEKGELVLLAADPQEHRELYKRQVLDGKTWNHPVVVGNRLYLRNAGEAVCFELPTR